MSARTNACVVIGLLLIGGALAWPGTGDAASGGSGLAAPGVSPSATATTNNPNLVGTVEPGNATVSATGNGIVLATRASAILRGALRFTGTVPAADAGSVLELERLGHETQWQWAPTANSTVGPGGSFTVVWNTNHIGRFQFRVVLEQGGVIRAASASPTVTAIVYLPAIASWYGGSSMNGDPTACGYVLRAKTFGVANRTLPCGTLVALYYRGRSIIVPVIDRGPYANHANWDLTAATAKALGMYYAGVATIGAASLPPQP